MVPKTGYWARDYEALLKEVDEGLALRTIKIDRETWNDDRWSRYGNFIIAKKHQGIPICDEGS